ncbi:nucleoside/nucleotide kinase family protein [Legionella spiritensis]|uniref:Uridine kinase n=1 Tax=Legionella spiritensis TaxID=452 RepID=A0A0W0ZAP5_LEGSP|nr:hypothetical protein [Legionella spiritensis]KTD66203.1 uridine kinase [Legionella spiritensis]SNV35222.1 uridine kinase [Legionella spiritensis]
MYVIAICGAYGSPIRTFAEDLYEFVTEKESSLSTILIDENEFLHDVTKRTLVDFPDLAAHIRKQDEDSIVLVVGNRLFLDENLQKTFNIRLFIDTANDICLSNHIKSQSEKRELDLVIDEYMKLLKPENDDHVNPSGKRADVIVPADKDFTIIFNLLFSSIQASLSPKESRVYDERDEEKSGYSFFG